MPASTENEPRADLVAFVSEYYGRLLTASADLATNACCVGGAPPDFIAKRLVNVHPDVCDRFYGCGFPIPHATEGATVLDLGCGTGRDVFVLAQLVGRDGRVHGIDMTPEQLAIARSTESWHADKFGYAQPNTSFHEGFIEDLGSTGLGESSVDVVVSNCVVNLSPRKDRVLAEAFRVLRAGGEFYLSDVFADRRLHEHIGNDQLLYAECLGGALYQSDFVRMARSAGFLDPRVVASAPITIQNAELARRVGAARFRSVTYRLFKLDDFDEQCEDYGQTAEYRGGIEGAEALFWLDDHHAFESGRPERVCANTAAMLSNTRYARWFDVRGRRDVHFGAFPCGPTMAASQYARSPSDATSTCC